VLSKDAGRKEGGAPNNANGSAAQKQAARKVVIIHSHKISF
jgi:hypothetical protein